MRRFASAAAVMAMTAGLLPIPATLPPVAADPAEGDSVEPLVVERLTPDALDEGSTLEISGTVTNTMPENADDVTVRMRYSRHSFRNRDELSDFASGTGWQPDAPGPEEPVAEVLAPDASEGYEIRVPVEDLDLSGFGVYPLVVEAVDGNGDRLGAQYTFLPYAGDDEDVPSVDIAWVWPLMDGPHRADDDTFLTGDLSASVAADGRLGRLLAAGAQSPLSFDPGDEDLVELLGLDEEPGEASDTATAQPAESTPSPEGTGPEGTETDAADGGAEETGEADAGAEESDEPKEVPVTWAVDPATLDDIVRLASGSHDVLSDPLALSEGADPGREESPPDTAAQVWLREAREALASDTVVATPYASPDLAALLRNDMGGSARASVAVGREAVPRALDKAADGSFALPANGLMDQDVYEFLATSGAHRFLLSESAKPTASWLSSTPTAQAPLDPVEGGPEEEPYALVADAGLAEVLAMPSREPGEAVLALQRFAAETAMIAGENAAEERVVVAYPGAVWDPGTDMAEGVLSATLSLPWLEAEPLDSVEPAPAEERETTRRALTYPEGTYSEELTSTYLSQVSDVIRDVRLFNSVLVGGSDPFRPAILRLESVHWRDRETLAGVTRSLLSDTVESDIDDVRIISGEPVTLASSTGTTGILVANDLEDEAVHIHLSLYSENSERLSVGEYTQDFEIAPGAKTTVYVPLSARINGRTELHASLQNAAGEPITTQDTVIPVNATGLGTQALAISAVGALILVIALAPRALRKWTRDRAKRARDDGPADTGDAPGTAGPDTTEETSPETNSTPDTDEGPEGETAPGPRRKES
ncbi:DUF6049 family protein [Nocardiopsis sp. CNT312]|uniref:DUF6049 family protein n=1 Tax=Nocardiopsis sp. CNT312 TaxID=1137268 RepID=UPI0004B40B4C|nr:DUF6049 family protein [Nocardiopsis sp. CNT312]